MTPAQTAMGATRVVNLRRDKFDVYIGRARHRRHAGQDGIFGNPYALTREADRAAVLEKFRGYFLERVRIDADFRRRILALRGKTLGCFCAPKPCHGDVIAAWVDAQPDGSP